MARHSSLNLRISGALDSLGLCIKPSLAELNNSDKILRILEKTHCNKSYLENVTWGFDGLIYVHFNINSIKENTHRKGTNERLS